MATSYKGFLPDTWTVFYNKCKQLFPFLKKQFIGTKATWNALTSEQQAKYDIVNLTDDNGEGLVVTDTVTEGDMNPITSNAVFLYQPVFELDSTHSDNNIKGYWFKFHITIGKPLYDKSLLINATRSYWTLCTRHNSALGLMMIFLNYPNGAIKNVVISNLNLLSGAEGFEGYFDGYDIYLHYVHNWETYLILKSFFQNFSHTFTVSKVNNTLYALGDKPSDMPTTNAITVS